MTPQHDFLEAIFGLTGKRAVVTGAAMGIGRAITEHLARAGASVVVADADAEAAQITEKELADLGLDVCAIRADVSQEQDVLDLVQAATEWRGGVDILVNDAGIFPTTPVLDMRTEEFERVVDVNLKGTYLCCRHLSSQMINQGSGGRIINITSVDALHPSTVGLAHYDASKHGVWGFTKNIALELAPHHIWVNAIAPGGIATPGVQRMQPRTSAGVDQADIIQRFLARIPMGRMGTPDEIGAVALFLAGSAASYITGSQIVVDGGVLLS